MKVAVIGTGTLGISIAQAFAQANGYRVTLCDRSEERILQGQINIEKNLARLVVKKKLTQQQADAILARITTGLLEHAADANLVIEAMSEHISLKCQALQMLDKLCPPETIFASHSLSLSPTELSYGLTRPIWRMVRPRYL